MLFQSLLMVCQGNICRSPMCEGYFRDKLGAVELPEPIIVRSAGLGALVGYPADQKARQVMAAHGVDISTHQARQISEISVARSDLILTMTMKQKMQLLRQYPMARGKAFSIGQWGQFDVIDPVDQSIEIFQQVYELIERAWKDWEKRIIQCYNAV